MTGSLQERAPHVVAGVHNFFVLKSRFSLNDSHSFSENVPKGCVRFEADDTFFFLLVREWQRHELINEIIVLLTTLAAVKPHAVVRDISATKTELFSFLTAYILVVLVHCQHRHYFHFTPLQEAPFSTKKKKKALTSRLNAACLVLNST